MKLAQSNNFFPSHCSYVTTHIAHMLPQAVLARCGELAQPALVYGQLLVHRVDVRLEIYLNIGLQFRDKYT